ncbi:MAG: hemerythrin domain-containing protein [Steroidobacteraceae bacterium]
MDQSKARPRRSSSGGGKSDAIALLKADHRQVEKWFAEFDNARSADRKARLAASICGALRAHMTVEEEIFYPAFLEATSDTDVHHEAIVEHDGAKRLIEEIESSSPEDDYFDARVTVLSEMIRHHVKEEEKPSGMFSEAKKSDMDLAELAERIRARKRELENGARRGEIDIEVEQVSASVA